MICCQKSGYHPAYEPLSNHNSLNTSLRNVYTHRSKFNESRSHSIFVSIVLTFRLYYFCKVAADFLRCPTKDITGFYFTIFPIRKNDPFLSIDNFSNGVRWSALSRDELLVHLGLLEQQGPLHHRSLI